MTNSSPDTELTRHHHSLTPSNAFPPMRRRLANLRREVASFQVLAEKMVNRWPFPDVRPSQILLGQAIHSYGGTPDVDTPARIPSRCHMHHQLEPPPSR